MSSGLFLVYPPKKFVGRSVRPRALMRGEDRRFAPLVQRLLSSGEKIEIPSLSIVVCREDIKLSRLIKSIPLEIAPFSFFLQVACSGYVYHGYLWPRALRAAHSQDEFMPRLLWVGDYKDDDRGEHPKLTFTQERVAIAGTHIVCLPD